MARRTETPPADALPVPRPCRRAARLTMAQRASGAIAGVLGAYLAMFPSKRVVIVIFSFIPFVVPAIVAIGMWALLQFVNGLGQIAMTEQTGGVAYLAHVGGFITGLIVGLMFRLGGRDGRTLQYLR